MKTMHSTPRSLPRSIAAWLVLLAGASAACGARSALRDKPGADVLGGAVRRAVWRAVRLDRHGRCVRGLLLLLVLWRWLELRRRLAVALVAVGFALHALP